MTVVIPSPAGVLVSEGMASSSGQQGPECPLSPLMGSPVGGDLSLLESSLSSALLPSLLHPRGGSSAGEAALLGFASGASVVTTTGLSTTAAVAAEVWQNDDVDDANASIKPSMEGEQASPSSGKNALYPPSAHVYNESSSGPTSSMSGGIPEDAATTVLHRSSSAGAGKGDESAGSSPSQRQDLSGGASDGILGSIGEDTIVSRGTSSLSQSGGVIGSGTAGRGLSGSGRTSESEAEDALKRSSYASGGGTGSRPSSAKLVSSRPTSAVSSKSGMELRGMDGSHYRLGDIIGLGFRVYWVAFIQNR